MVDLKQQFRSVLAQNSPVSNKGMSLVIRVILVGVVLIILAMVLISLTRSGISRTASFGEGEIAMKRKCQELYRAAKRCEERGDDLANGPAGWMCKNCPGYVDMSSIKCSTEYNIGGFDPVDNTAQCK